MFQLAILGGALLVGACIWLSEEENDAINDYYRSSDRLHKETKKRKEDIENVYHHNVMSYDFESNIVLYKASVQSANATYQSYDQQKTLMNICYNKKQQFGEQIGKLKQQRDQLKARKANGEGVGGLLNEAYEKLKQVREFFAQVKAEIKNLKTIKETLLRQVRELNNSTHQLKSHIRDNYGKGGRMWYERKFEGKHDTKRVK